MSGLAIPNTAKRPPAGLALPGAVHSTSNSPAPSSAAAIQLQPRPSSAAPAAQGSGAGGRAGESGRPSASPSPEPDEDGEAEGDDDEDEGLGQSSKKSSKGSKKKKGAPAAATGLEAGGKQDYKYTNEISQMVSNAPGAADHRCSCSEKSKTPCRKQSSWWRTLCAGRSSRLYGVRRAPLILPGHSREAPHAHSLFPFPVGRGLNLSDS